ELAHHERRALVERQVRERAAQVLRVRAAIVVLQPVGHVVVVCDLLRPALRLPEALAADVVSDGDQPVLRLPRPLSALVGAVGVQALAAARLRLGTWMARPSATRPASLIASESVGCGAMPSPTVSTVASASIATTPASIRSVTCGPTMTSPRSSP